MVAKKTVIVARPFKDRDGKDHRIGERIEVDPDYGVELEQKGDVHPEQPIAQPPKAEPKG
jgi:hypothetical protein